MHGGMRRGPRVARRPCRQAALLAAAPALRYPVDMPDDLYDRDILAWSEHQSTLLRRVARGERLNDVDWDHVVEEIEDVGLSELNAVRSYLRQMLVHLLKLYGWPDSTASDHWRLELRGFQADAVQRFAPSMRQRIEVTTLYRRAYMQLEGLSLDNRPPRQFPEACPFSLDDLLEGDPRELESRLASPGP
jgi:hypothetical protein